MVLPDGTIYTYADGAVVPSPNSQQLCDIAYSTAKNIETILGIQPRVAFLSFSTKGSAKHPDIEKFRMRMHCLLICIQTLLLRVNYNLMPQ